MYTCRFVSDDKGTFYFGYYQGVIFDLDPLGELDVEISTSQGYFQIGNTLEAETVSGVSRELRGVFLDYTDTDLAQSMIDIFTPGTHGKLYFNDTHYCECTVEKTPAITLSGKKRSFSLMLYSPYPYWVNISEDIYMLGGYEAAFEFPVCYDEHCFGVKNADAYTNCYNYGSVERPLVLEISCEAEVVNYGVENIYTGEFIQFDDTLEYGEIVNVFHEETMLRITKTVDGVASNAFSILNEDSTLFSLAPGYNYLKQYADSGVDSLVIYVNSDTAEAGVLAT